jgi:hypothetical protein
MQWPACPEALDFVTRYFGLRGRADEVSTARANFANVYFWLPAPQMEAARGAAAQHRHQDAIRLATRAYRLAFLANAEAAQLIGQTCMAQSNYSRAAAWLARASQILMHSPNQSGVVHQQIENISTLRQQCLRALGCDAAALAAWLDGWWINTGLARIYEFTNLVEEVWRDPRRWARFSRTAHGAAAMPAALRRFPAWYAARDTSNAHRMACAIATTATARTWPLYCYVLGHSPGQAGKGLVIAPARLRAVGFEPTEWWDAALLWFETYYSIHGDLAMALSYWDMVNQERSNFTAVAVINQAKLEMQERQFSNAVLRIAQHADALRAVPWTSERAQQMLRIVASVEAGDALSNLTATTLGKLVGPASPHP